MKGKLKIVPLIIILVIVVIGVVAAVLIFKNKAKSAEVEEHNPSKVESYAVTLGDMYCNMKSEKKLLKLKMTVQTSNAEVQPVIEAKQHVIRDEVNRIVRNNTYEDLMGMNGMDNLRKAIQRNLVEYFKDETLVIYFDDFVIQ